MSDIFKITDGKSGQFTSFNDETKGKTWYIKPNETLTLIDHKGCGIINRMWLTFPCWFKATWDDKLPEDRTMLRKCIMRIYYDGNDFPSVEAPLGDFFGVGHCEYRHYLSKYLGMSSGGFYCYFPIPYKKGIRIEFANMHESIPLSVFFNANYTEYAELPKDTGYFHCQYMAGTNSGYDPTLILDTEGKGHYVGCSVSLQGKDVNSMFYLEAPEYVFIDGEEKARIIGTGFEDYYNGGWYFRNGEFYAPYHGVPLKDGARSEITMYRFHDEDKILFDKSIKFQFDHPFKRENLTEFKYTSTSYYYLTKPGKLKPLPPKDKLVDFYSLRENAL